MKKGADKGSECASCGLKSCICCFWFLEKFIRYLNHNAYTVIAIESVNFCPAAGIVRLTFLLRKYVLIFNIFIGMERTVVKRTTSCDHQWYR